jgi:biofilm PGA synthesis N-glycosyltransferase PgaC
MWPDSTISAELVLGASLGVVAYTFVGYPALIWLLARIRPRPAHRVDVRPSVAIVIVAFNEGTRIRRKLESCLEQSYPRDLLRIVVASDGSTDATDSVVGEFAGKHVTLLAYRERRGKASCLNDAAAACGEEILVLTDARQRLDPGAVASLVANFGDPSVGAVSGELLFEPGESAAFGGGLDAYWRYEKFIRRNEATFCSTVGATGALYAIRRSDFRPIPGNTILDDVLIPMNVVMLGRRVVFDDCAHAFDEYPSSLQQEQARKVRTLAGNYQLILSHPRFLHPFRNPVFFQLMSHKVARLFAPWALVAVLLCSLYLSRTSVACAALAVVQAAGYGLGVMGLLWPETGRFRVVRLAAAFITLNVFAVLGFLHFLSGRELHLWKRQRADAETPGG